MKTALTLAGRILAAGTPRIEAGRITIGGQEFPESAIEGYTLESVPDAAQPGWLREGGEWRAPVVAPTAEEIAAACGEIDRLCDVKRNRYISAGSLVVEEYRLAARQAAAYKAAGYSGAVPASVQAWATAKGWTATQAADDILAVEAAWMAVLAAIRNIRLPAKEQARAATDRAILADVLAGVRAALAQIPEA
jgi:hypothetical protein